MNVLLPHAQCGSPPLMVCAFDAQRERAFPYYDRADFQSDRLKIRSRVIEKTLSRN